MTEDLAEVMGQITHGVYVIGVCDGEQQNAFTASWVMQVSFKPLLIAFSINPEHYSYKLLQKGGVCSINVLGKEQMEIAAHFGLPYNKSKMEGYEWLQNRDVPVLATAAAYFDCKVSHYTEAGDHKIVVCEVLNAEILKKYELLLYADTAAMDGGSENYKQP
ncbi:MAG: flavin reductase [Methylococcaceae bacterium]|nr:flavin reductase [Methylococcaceae bacterium]